MVRGKIAAHAACLVDWITHGHDYAETHYSPLKQIDAKNVQRLGLAILARVNPNSRLFVFTLDGKEPIPQITPR